MLFGQAWGLRPVGDQRWGHGGLRVKWLFFGVDIVHHSDLAAEIITRDGEDHGCEPNLTPFRIGGVGSFHQQFSTTRVNLARCRLISRITQLGEIITAELFPRLSRPLPFSR